MSYTPPAVQRAKFMALLGNPDVVFSSEILDREFDEDNRRLTGEPLDWHQARHWPALATD
jgi:hypothetical protein